MEEMVEVLAEARSALSRQADDVVRKTDSLRQLARSGMAAVAAQLAGIGILVQTGHQFSTAAQAIVATGLLMTLLGIIKSIVAATLFDATDLPVGPDPEALLAAVDAGADMASLNESRATSLIRMRAYNQESLAITAKRATRALYTLVGGTVIAVLGFVFLLWRAIP